MQIFTGNALCQLVGHSDLVTKFVLLLLLIMSVICWTIALVKVSRIWVKVKQLQSIRRLLEKANNQQELSVVATQLPLNDSGMLLKDIILLVQHERPTDIIGWESLSFKVHQYVDDMITEIERYVPFISTSAAVSTLIGLFGTVWGLIHSFVRISEKQAADIVTVAPGIAEALITTLAGLMVAIPALVLFHYVVSTIHGFENQLRRCVDYVLWTSQK